MPALFASRLWTTPLRSAPMGHRRMPGRNRRSGMRPTRWSVVRHAPMRPRVTLRIPGPPPVIIAPVGHQREADDRQAEPGSVRDERHPPSLINEGDSARVDPPPAVLERDVAPAPVVQAAVHVERCPGIELGDERVFPIRPRADVDGTGSVGVLRAREAERNEQQRSQRINQRASAHGQISGLLRASIVERNHGNLRMASHGPDPETPGPTSTGPGRRAAVRLQRDVVAIALCGIEFAAQDPH